MTPHDFREDTLVEQPAVGLFAELGWQTLSGSAADLGRETRSDVVLVERLRQALLRFNPTLPPEAIASATEELTRDRSAMSQVAANRELYLLMKEGVQVSVPDRDEAGRVRGGQKTQRLRVIDWEHPEANDFLLVRQFSVVGQLYTCRPDLVGFVNGLPWVVVELKKPGVPVHSAFEENLRHYKSEIPQLFWYNALLIASNGTASRVGSITAAWNRFFEWKRIASEDELRRVSMEVMLRGTCEPTRLLDLVENFTLFSEHKAGLIKAIAQNHQFLGVNNAIASMQQARLQEHGRGGVFWQTQGSGKSFSMVFFAQKILRKLVGNWTFVVVTDRAELDEQIAKTFKAVGAVSKTESDLCHAQSGEHLKALLRGNHRYVFTLIHKFRDPELLTERSDIIVLNDEAHRSQYETLATNMRAALPNATFLAFTGTPLIAGEEKTKDLFGDYVSIYDFQQSVEDGATVPLFYENRTPELELVNPDLDEHMQALIEDAGLDDEQEARLEKLLGRQYHLLTRDDRLDTIAKDIVAHFLGRGFVGKAMVIAIDKATALRMYDKVQARWAAETQRVQQELGELAFLPREGQTPAELAQHQARKTALQARLQVLTTTDMALIVSAAQNEIEHMRKLGLNIKPHRQRMTDSQPGLDEKFKDTDDPLRIVFVCAMWLTGFDAPSCSTIYLDKPMRNHTLMQTIARANRVFPGKHSGMIVDYANVFTSLEKALAIYGKGKGGANPVKNKAALVTALREAVQEALAFCARQGVDLDAMAKLPMEDGQRLRALEDAVEALIAPESLRREFFAHEKLVSTLYNAVKPDPVVLTYADRVAGILGLAAAVRSQLSPHPPDLREVLAQISGLLDESIAGLTIREEGPPPIDLSRINFEALAERFGTSKHKNTDIEALKAAIRARVERLVRLNRTRTNFADTFEALIASYNAGTRSIEELFQDLLRLSNNLDEEQERHVREHLTEEELVIFDILTRPAPELTPEARAEVKKVARELLNRIKELLVLNWRQKSTARSSLKLAIQDTLDLHLPTAYEQELYNQKCSAIFEHIFETYPERNTSIYAEAG